MANIKLRSWLCCLVIIQSYVNAYTVEPVAILPVEVMPRYSPRYLPNVNPPPMERLDAASLPMPQEALLHRNTDPPPRSEVRESYEYLRDAAAAAADERSADENSTNLLNDFLRAIGVDDSENQESRDNSRPYQRDQYSLYPQQHAYRPQLPSYQPQHQSYQQQQPSYQQQQPSYQPQQPSYQQQQPPSKPQQPSYSQQSYPVQQYSQTYSGLSRPTYSPVPPSINYGSPAYLQPAHLPTYKTLDLIKPFASKVSTKIGGLLSIVLALLGGGGASGLSGFKDILVNGIIKPLFSLKGGLKELISKLSIPVLSLLLINVEVLLTIWWLWDDCPQVAHAAYAAPVPAPAVSSYQYPKPQPVYSYNTNY